MQTVHSRRTWINFLWWAALIASLVILLCALPEYLEQARRPIGASLDFSDTSVTANWLGVAFSLVASLVSLGLAVVLHLRRPDDRMAFLVSIFLMYYGVILAGPVEFFTTYWLPESPSLGLILQSILTPVPVLLMILIFPNGRFEPHWSYWLVILVIVGALYSVTLSAEELVKINSLRSLSLYLVFVVIFSIALGIALYRYRKIYSQAERQQTKWVIYGVILELVLLALCFGPYYYLVNLPAGTSSPAWASISSTFWWLSLCITPLAFTISILRFHLWDIDLVIRRTLVYGALTIILGLVYFGSVVLLQNMFSTTTGQNSAIGIVLSTLAIAALFNPLRLGIQRFIDRRFYRTKYDADRVLQEFSDKLRHDIDLDDLQAELLAVVQKTLRPEQASLWLNSGSQPRPLDHPAFGGLARPVEHDR